MKILIINYEFPPLGGGASPVSYELAKRYIEAGHEVDVVTMHYKGLPKREKKEGINIIRIKSIRSKKELCHLHEMLSFVISAFFFLRIHLKKNKYDFNHTHFLIPSGLISWWIKRKFGLKYIVTPHGSDVPGYNEDRFTFSHHFTKPLLRRIANNAEKIISPSNYLGNLIINNISSKLECKILKIPNGIDPTIFLPAERKEKIILTTGRLLPRKGMQYLIKAVMDEDIGYEVHICGDGPMRNELEQLASKSKTQIVFHGWIDNKSEKYKQLLAKASIYTLVSSKENASISLLEAMSAGCGVVTSSVSGCPETVGDAGVIVPPENVDALKQAINQLITEQEFLTKKMQKARQTVETKFDWEKITIDYLKLMFNHN